MIIKCAHGPVNTPVNGWMNELMCGFHELIHVHESPTHTQTHRHTYLEANGQGVMLDGQFDIIARLE